MKGTGRQAQTFGVKFGVTFSVTFGVKFGVTVGMMTGDPVLAGSVGLRQRAQNGAVAQAIGLAQGAAGREGAATQAWRVGR